MNVRMINLEIMGDDRGSLIALEEMQNIPFEIKRVYYIFGTKKDVRRGLHAHKTLRQVAICLHGSCKFHLDDGHNNREVILDRPDIGLYIDTLIWREMSDFSPDCVLVVLASDHYNESDYIRDHAKFMEIVNGSVHSQS